MLSAARGSDHSTRGGGVEGGVRSERNPLIAKFWMLLGKGFEPAEAPNANTATGHANPHNSPEPQRFHLTSFSAPVRRRPRPSADSVEAAWRRIRQEPSSFTKSIVTITRRSGSHRPGG